jgi:hypothetical protein
MTPAGYRAKAEQLLEEAHEAEPKGSPERSPSPLKYLRLADLPEKRPKRHGVRDAHDPRRDGPHA